MGQTTQPSAEDIRAARIEHAKLRERDLADKLGITEAQLIAAHTGQGVTHIAPHPDNIIGIASQLGEVMALTRNISCVNEKVGHYGNYTSGAHAAMVLNDRIDLRMFPSHWCHAFMVEKATDTGTRRSLQVFDAAGDAVHKIFMRDATKVAAWDAAKAALALPDQPTALDLAERAPVEAAKPNPEKLDVLQTEWSKMTDTHQFMRLTSKLRMNRLGAYRIVGAPFVRPLATGAIDRMLNDVQAAGIEVMVFVGNRGCIQIHTGPIETLKPMGPWQNVMDPGFNLHLRLDHVAEVYAVDKPTQRGKAVSVEAFDAEGGLIFQVFGVRKDDYDSRPAWREIVDALPALELKAAE
ncbi:ChuX/HutX family heme-like substrate-binding protein [Pseudosulfitobacter sp. DSM 107133]|uniref:hemin-degrading factor n=1 Tax=Pseudosulfitobacter sp. DSM 107133 TaxID=2883100 RepID=UPI000DF46407|nr:ChuX/HutX family heme-like substrate-binding protein [Pseudosulfitobacter sp. DSM 107133]UOA27831.1 Hemin transport protein HemS [Pseudosulfitobacter sp. DSM 107133]